MKIFECIIYAFIICIALNNPFVNSKIYMVAPITAVLYYFACKIKKDEFHNLFKSGIYILIFYIVYSSTLFYYNLGTPKNLLVHAFLPFSLFIIGYLFMLKKDSNKFVNMLATISFSSCIYVALCLALTIKRHGIMNYGSERVVFNIWDKSNIINVTNMTAFLVLANCLIGVLIARNNKKSKLLVLMAIIEIIIGVVYAIYTGGRTAMMIMPVMLVLTFLIIPNIIFKKVKFLLAIGICASIVIYIYHYNVWWIRDVLESTTLGHRLRTEDIFNDIRFFAWKEVIQSIPYYPFGGREISIFLRYAHNIFLDTIYYGGLQSFIFLVLFMTQYLYKTITIILKDDNKTLCAILSAFSVGSFIFFSVEPVLQGSILMFSIFTFIFGMASSYFYKFKSKALDKVFLDSHL